jgi:hypothetical protein
MSGATMRTRRAMRDSISETQRFASAFVGCRDAL